MLAVPHMEAKLARKPLEALSDATMYSSVSSRPRFSANGSSDTTLSLMVRRSFAFGVPFSGLGLGTGGAAAFFARRTTALSAALSLCAFCKCRHASFSSSGSRPSMVARFSAWLAPFRAFFGMAFNLTEI